MSSRAMRAAVLVTVSLMSGAAIAQTAAPATSVPAAGSAAAQPAAGTNSPKTAPVKPGQTLHNGPNAATGTAGSGNAGAGGGVAPGQQ